MDRTGSTDTGLIPKQQQINNQTFSCGLTFSDQLFKKMTNGILFNKLNNLINLKKYQNNYLNIFKNIISINTITFLP